MTAMPTMIGDVTEARTRMQLLLDGRPERWAVLTVNPAAEARAIYERAGRKHIASTKTSRSWPGMHIMLFNRRTETSATVDALDPP